MKCYYLYKEKFELLTFRTTFFTRSSETKVQSGVHLHSDETSSPGIPKISFTVSSEEFKDNAIFVPEDIIEKLFFKL